jgi:hypothetical protein
MQNTTYGSVMYVDALHTETIGTHTYAGVVLVVDVCAN